MLNDDDILLGLQQGDSKAVEELVERFQAPLLAYFQCTLRDRSLAEDATQEIFLRLVQSVRSGKTTRIQHLAAYVFTMARRLVVDLGRSSQRLPHQLDEQVEGALPPVDSAHSTTRSDPLNQAIHHEQLDQVREAMLALDPGTRQVMILRHVEDLSCRDVAHALGIPEGTVWARLHRGLQYLRKRLGGRSGPPPPPPSPSHNTIPHTRKGDRK